ncbi:AraC family transcriptional regulator, partial [Salmonella enterica subsp. enterica serovar Cerro]|nr:AraC family transcriptional regulator [Salmonella enterica subsp. enterica serovar Cerro]
DNNRLTAAVNLLSLLVNSFAANTDAILVKDLPTSLETDYALSAMKKTHCSITLC